MTANEPLASETIALTEKKVDMALDDIIKMSKNDTNKGKTQWRAVNKNQKLNGAKENVVKKFGQYMDSRSVIRQGAFAKRRSNFQGDQFPVALDIARKAAYAPIRGRSFNASGVVNTNKLRVGAPPVQRKATNNVFPTNGGFSMKTWHQRDHKEQQTNPAARQQPQTLDSLFANMKEQRMRAFSQQKSNTQWKGGVVQGVPWARSRGRFGN